MFKDLSFDSSSRGDINALRETIKSLVYSSFHWFQDSLIDQVLSYIWGVIPPRAFSCVLKSILLFGQLPWQLYAISWTFRKKSPLLKKLNQFVCNSRMIAYLHEPFERVSRLVKRKRCYDLHRAGLYFAYKDCILSALTIKLWCLHCACGHFIPD